LVFYHGGYIDNESNKDSIMNRMIIVSMIILSISVHASAQGVAVVASLESELSTLSKTAFKTYMEYVGSASDYARVLKTADDTLMMPKLNEQLEKLETTMMEKRKAFLGSLVDDGMSDQRLSNLLVNLSGFAHIEVVDAYFEISRTQPKFAKHFHEGRMSRLIEEDIGRTLLGKCHHVSAAVKAYSLKNIGHSPKSLHDVLDFLDKGKAAITDPWGELYEFKLEQVELDGKLRTQVYVWTKNPNTGKLYGLVAPSALKKIKK
jgi:hypothetical protein